MSGPAHREPPWRIAFLEPELRLAQVDAPLRGTAGLLLYVTLFQHLVRHPDLAVIDPDDTAIETDDGQVVNLAQRHTDECRSVLFGEDRRDELLWYELQLAGPGAPVRLHTLGHAGERQSFAALGAQPLFAKIASCLRQWLAARDLGDLPAPLEEVDDVAFLAICRSLRAALPSEAPAERDGLHLVEDEAQDEASEPAGDGPEEQDTQDEEAEGGSDAPTLEKLGLTLPSALGVPFLRAYGILTGGEVHRAILDLDPDDPWSLRDQLLGSLRRGRDFPLLRRLLALAPSWGKPYLSYRRIEGATSTRKTDDGFDDDDATHAFAAAALRIPGNHWALGNYANVLEDEGRLPEAVRYRARALAAARGSSRQLRSLIWTHSLLGRRGEHLAMSRAWVQARESSMAPEDRGFDSDLFRAKLTISTALRAVGRLGEACALREDLLRGNETRWPQQLQVLERWRSDPAELAQSYAWEGHFRGDPGRVIEGLSAVSPNHSSGFELRALMSAFIALGEPRQAAYAWAHFGAQNVTHFAATRIEAARALLLVGDLPGALDEMLGVMLRHSQHGFEMVVHRLLRLSVASGASAWGAVVEKHRARGALTLARLLARDAADFVPGAGDVPPIAAVLGTPTPVPFSPDWMEPLRQVVEPEISRRVDGLFEVERATLAEADRLVEQWPGVLHGPAGSAEAAQEALYAAVQAIARYLAATTATASPLAGALRTVACEALQACALAAPQIPDGTVRAALAVLDQAAVSDEATFDTWLLRVERALAVEDRWNGHLETPSAGLLRVAPLLRGDERVAAEYRLAHRLRREKPDGWAASAHPLFERCMRAGAAPFHAWSEAAAQLGPEQAVDALWTCAFAAQGHALPSVDAAKVFLAHNRPDDALEVLCHGLGFGGKDWRKDRVTELAALWKEAAVDVPIDWKRCSSQASAALQKGQLDRAIRCFRWCAALEPDNRELWRNLGIACAQKGEARAAVAAFARFDEATEGVKLAGLVLCQAKHAAEGLAVLDYIARWFTKAEDHRYHAVFAWQAGNDDAMLRAYGRAWATDPAALTGVDLDGYAAVLIENGHPEASERVIERLESLGGSDAELRGCALHRRAQVAIERDRWQDAVALAEEALKINPSAARRPTYEETLGRAKQREKRPAPSATEDEAAPVYRALAEGDLDVVLTHSGSSSWRHRHAVLLASELRYETENDIGVTSRARRAAEQALADSGGASELTAALVRTEALRIRQAALFPVDPPALLGDRLTRAQFRRELALRRGEPPPEEPAAAPTADMELAAGAPIVRASQYAELLRALQGADPLRALAARGLDLAAYEEICAAWTEGLAASVELSQAVRARMTSRPHGA